MGHVTVELTSLVVGLTLAGCRARQRRLTERLQHEQIDRMLVFDRRHVYYLSGYWSASYHTPLLILTKDGFCHLVLARNPFVDDPPPPSGDHAVSYTLPVLTKDGEIITPPSVGGTGGMWLMRFNSEWLYETSRKTDFANGADGWNSFGTNGVEVVAHPDQSGARVLQLRKPKADWPAAAVWNFPNAMRGRIQIRLKLNPGFSGARIGLTDHFSVAFDPEDEYHNLFNLSIGSEGKLQQSEITPGRWHKLELDWNIATRECRVFVDGVPAETLLMQRRTTGVNYLRFCSTAEDTDTAGFLLESVDASISE